MSKEYLIIEDRRWNGEEITIKKVITGTDEVDASNKVFKWLLKNQSCSVTSALNNQGYYALKLSNKEYLKK